MSGYSDLYPSDGSPGKVLFFTSDLHLGIPTASQSRERERHFIHWLETVAPRAAALYLLGDIWDFWFEYKHCVPKGTVRLLGALARLCDEGLPIYFMPGNHDQWLMGYLEEEVGLRRLADPYQARYMGWRFFISHGQNIGPLPWYDRLANWIMGQPILQRLYRAIHPDWGLRLGRYLSGRSRQVHHPLDDTDLGEKEYFYQFIKAESAKGARADWYLFAHRHFPKFQRVGAIRYLVLGDWIRRYTYLEIEGDQWALRRFEGPQACPSLIEGLIGHAMVAA